MGQHHLAAPWSPSRPSCFSGKHIQELSRTHDTNSLVLLDGEQIWITGHHETRTTLDGRGKVLVVVRIVADALDRVLPRNEVRE